MHKRSRIIFCGIFLFFHIFCIELNGWECTPSWASGRLSYNQIEILSSSELFTFARANTYNMIYGTREQWTMNIGHWTPCRANANSCGRFIITLSRLSALLLCIFTNESPPFMSKCFSLFLFFCRFETCNELSISSYKNVPTPNISCFYIELNFFFVFFFSHSIHQNSSIV